MPTTKPAARSESDGGRRVSAFAGRVYAALRRVPRGRVVTYGELARALRCGSARAIGQALKRNPFAPDVPCHRVIRSDLRPGGYQGRTGDAAMSRKLALLAAEGVCFVRGRLTDPGRLFTFDDRPTRSELHRNDTPRGSGSMPKKAATDCPAS